MAKDFKPHLFIKNVHKSQKFTGISSGRGTKKEFPERDRKQHGDFLLGQLSSVWTDFNEQQKERQKQDLPVKDGEYISIIGSQDQLLSLDTLNSKNSTGAQLLNVKYNEKTKQQTATIHILKNDKLKLIDKVNKYIYDNRPDTGKPFNEPLVVKTDNILKATILDFWSSPIDFIPRDKEIWIELWLGAEANLFEKIKVNFTHICNLFNIQIGEGVISFPERTIINIKANYNQLTELIKSFDYIAELRKPDELNTFWLKNNIIEREEWINDTLKNTKYNKTNNFISIIDTGINNGHLLIEPVLSDNNKLTADINWGTNDIGGHGTRIAGVATYGDLKNTFQNPNKNIINHELESIKIIPPEGWDDDSKLPLTTINAVRIATINNPYLKRIYCFAVCSKYPFDFGKPSAWSAAIDNIIFDRDDNDKKLFFISAGNVNDEDNYDSYPENNLNSQILSPAQSWNSISVGAFTHKVLDNTKTVANRGELSPFSRTSNGWKNNWPIKPDIVFEGGNLIRLNNGEIDFNDDLEVLTTSSNAAINKLTTINATSAATAFAANFAAKLRHIYPDAWEETLRGLIIHSASWSEAMRKQLNFDKKQNSIIKMLRTFGYGIPNLEKAISCKENYLTFISEQTIQPYIKESGKDPKTHHAHYYEFPWPKEILEGLGETMVTLRITLSYFIEPNPGEKGYSTKYSYQSTALKFSLIRPGESHDNFFTRTNKTNKDNLRKELGLKKGEKIPPIELDTTTGNNRWGLGADNTFKGSIHCNYWEGTAADISSCNFLAVYPQATGWWKNLKKQKKFNENLRYSLIVSIETPENTSDIYTKIAQQVKIKNLVNI